MSPTSSRLDAVGEVACARLASLLEVWVLCELVQAVLSAYWVPLRIVASVDSVDAVVDAIDAVDAVDADGRQLSSRTANDGCDCGDALGSLHDGERDFRGSWTDGGGLKWFVGCGNPGTRDQSEGRLEKVYHR